MTHSNLEEISVVSDVYEQPLVVFEPGNEEELPVRKRRTYRPTKWPLVNSALDIVDSVTDGRAGKLQPVFSFVFIGGLASLVNIGVLALVLYIKMPVNDTVHSVIAFLLASEISILANFIPNDYFTFSHLAGHARSWNARCLRYHMTSISGTVLTFLIWSGLQYELHVPKVIAQAVAILIVLFYNFAVHHLFTYRNVKAAAV